MSLLSADQEFALARRIERGDLAAKRALIEVDLLPPACSIPTSFTGCGLPLLDLIQEGNLGLLRAVEDFDYRSTPSSPPMSDLVDLSGGRHPGLHSVG